MTEPMRKNNFKAALFDMDGVIIDSELYWSKVEEDYAMRHGIPFTWRYRRRIMAVPSQELSIYIKKKYNLPETIADLTRDRLISGLVVYKKYASLLPGFLPLIKQVRKAGLITAIVTSSPWFWTKPLVNRLKLKKYFDTIISTDDMKRGRGKPHPDIYLFTAKKIGVKPAECLVFEDAINGIASAKAAGMYCVAIPDKRWVKDRRGVGKADMVVKSLADEHIYRLLDIKY